MITLYNFTFEVVSFYETAGNDWSINNPTTELLLTPLPGYTLDAADFSPTLPYPQYVNSVLFLNNAGSGTVTCLIVYDSPSVMPSSNVFIEICGSGFARPSLLSVSGQIDQCNVSNVKIPLPGAPSVSYSATGDYGTTTTFSTYTVTANTTYYFPTMPTLTVVDGVASDYTITGVPSYDANGEIEQVVFTIAYTFPGNSVSGDNICLTANAVATYNPPVKITSYSFPVGNTVPTGGETRNFTVNGVEGASWALNITSSGLFSPVNASGTLDSTGTFVVPVVFPSVTANTTYTITLTGDLANTFCTVAPYVPCLTGQPSVFTLNQYVNSTLSFAFTSANTNITPDAATTITLLPGSSQPSPFNVIVTGSSTSILTVDSIPPPADWTNQGGLVGGSWDFNVISSSFVVDNSTVPTIITSTLSVNVTSVGITNTSSALDLDQYVSDGGAWNATLCGGATTYYVSDADGWSGGTNQSQLGSLVNAPYAPGNIVQIKSTATGEKLCVTLGTFASGETPTYYIDEGFQNQVSTFATCTICNNQNQ